MKITSLLRLSGIVSPVLAFPSFFRGDGSLDTRQTWEPRPFTAPGPDDGERLFSWWRGRLPFPAEPAADGEGGCIARGPCPGLNTLANHGYLPPSGRNITRAMLADAMLEGFNIDKADAVILFSQAVRTNPQPLARTFDLDTLGREGVLEHDFSLRCVKSGCPAPSPRRAASPRSRRMARSEPWANRCRPSL